MLLLNLLTIFISLVFANSIQVPNKLCNLKRKYCKLKLTIHMHKNLEGNFNNNRVKFVKNLSKVFKM